MAGYSNENSGALFKNKEKQTEKHPDYRGNLNVDGTDYYISSWLKTSKAGEKYMSLSITPKNENNTRSPPKSKRVEDEFTDEIPF